MGTGLYSTTYASTRSTLNNYSNRSTADIFEQSRKRQIHKLMNPKDVKIRECRDSESHPNSLPIIIAIDVTGSMKEMPKYYIAEALIKLVTKIMEAGFTDPAIMVIAVGDGKTDVAPLQISQFESGDAELDMWLSRIWPEGNGGGNGGESYNLVWYFAANHTVSDSYEKRGKKGLLITMGDEPVHSELTRRELKEIFNNDSESNLTNDYLLEEVRKTYDVYHMHINEGTHGTAPLEGWRRLLGENCIEIQNYTKVPDKIADLVIYKAKDVIADGTVPSTTHPGESGPKYR